MFPWSKRKLLQQELISRIEVLEQKVTDTQHELDLLKQRVNLRDNASKSNSNTLKPDQHSSSSSSRQQEPGTKLQLAEKLQRSLKNIFSSAKAEEAPIVPVVADAIYDMPGTPVRVSTAFEVPEINIEWGWTEQPVPMPRSRMDDIYKNGRMK